MISQTAKTVIRVVRERIAKEASKKRLMNELDGAELETVALYLKIIQEEDGLNS